VKGEQGINTRRVYGVDELRRIYALRYQVYCNEWGFERPEDHPGGLETDEFDPQSVHFIETFDDGRIIGTARIILDSPAGFPIESHCKLDIDLKRLNRQRMGEISRLAISKEVRRRSEDRIIYESVSEGTTLVQTEGDRRRRQLFILNLYKCIYTESKRLGITHWLAVMAKGLYLLLRRAGIVFCPIGAEVYYHGQRTPYLGVISEMEEQVAKTNPELFKEFSEEL
jgi:N-acyl amino acid synthase of PEP-CTERM/exosortase system